MQFTPFFWIVAGFVVLSLAFDAVFLIAALRPAIRARTMGIQITPFEILRMRFRRIPPSLVIEAAINLRQQGIEVAVSEIEEVYVVKKESVFHPDDLARFVADRRRRTDSAET